MKEELFRKKSLDKVKSPEKLNDYVRVASPALWLVLIGTILLLAGAIVWASVFNLETNISTSGSATGNSVALTFTQQDFKNIKEGLKVVVEDKEGKIESVDKEKHMAYTTIAIADGNYTGYVVAYIHPISYLLN